jgi:hypothetical protein
MYAGWHRTGATLMSDTDMPERTYYAQIPNLIDDAGLSVYAFRLLAHIRRIAGDTGECWEGTRTLAEKCGMSVGQVSNAKAELVKRGFISITRRPIRGGFVDELRPVDVWAENEVKYRSVHTVNTYPPSVQDTNTNPLESVHTVNTNGLSVHTVNAGVHQVNESITIDQEQDHGAHSPQAASNAPRPKTRKSRTKTNPNRPSEVEAAAPAEPPTPAEIRQAYGDVCDVDLSPGAKPPAKMVLLLNGEAKALWTQQQGRGMSVAATVRGIHETASYTRATDRRFKDPASRLPIAIIRENWTAAGRWAKQRKAPANGFVPHVAPVDKPGEYATREQLDALKRGGVA